MGCKRGSLQSVRGGFASGQRTEVGKRCPPPPPHERVALQAEVSVAGAYPAPFPRRLRPRVAEPGRCTRSRLLRPRCASRETRRWRTEVGQAWAQTTLGALCGENKRTPVFRAGRNLRGLHFQHPFYGRFKEADIQREVESEPGFSDFSSDLFPLHYALLTKYQPLVAKKIFSLSNAENRSHDT